MSTDPEVLLRISQLEKKVTELYGALTWMRDNTSEDTVIIVNNQQAESTTGYATAYDYAAFSERHYFLAGWGYSLRTRDAASEGQLRALRGHVDPFFRAVAAQHADDLDAALADPLPEVRLAGVKRAVARGAAPEVRRPGGLGHPLE